MNYFHDVDDNLLWPECDWCNLPAVLNCCGVRVAKDERSRRKSRQSCAKVVCAVHAWVGPFEGWFCPEHRGQAYMDWMLAQPWQLVSQTPPGPALPMLKQRKAACITCGGFGTVPATDEGAERPCWTCGGDGFVALEADHG